MNKISTGSTASKVPEITLFFWIIKILTTGIGESASDFLVSHINPFIAIVITGIILVAALTVQFKQKKYIVSIYWFTVIMVAVFGTMAADAIHVGLGIPYLASALFFAIVLAFVFILWYVKEKTLSIHSIHSVRREVFYWAVVLSTFALGTAVGDMTASTLGLGYFSSAILFAVLIIIVTIAHYAAKKFLSLENKHQSTNAVLAFWLAYILTRPLGASMADWLGKSPVIGGLGLGDGTVSICLAVLIVVFVGCLIISKKDIKS